mmetsp:Transcript_38992/g.63887  ORF Transcript_38992/g.63887 Transcript_38992/m.63887 type:complete len:304 (-) Transcript_38992:123-1034(-)
MVRPLPHHNGPPINPLRLGHAPTGNMLRLPGQRRSGGGWHRLRTSTRIFRSQTTIGYGIRGGHHDIREWGVWILELAKEGSGEYCLGGGAVRRTARVDRFGVWYLQSIHDRGGVEAPVCIFLRAGGGGGGMGPLSEWGYQREGRCILPCGRHHQDGKYHRSYADEGADRHPLLLHRRNNPGPPHRHRKCHDHLPRMHLRLASPREKLRGHGHIGGRMDVRRAFCDTPRSDWGRASSSVGYGVTGCVCWGQDCTAGARAAGNCHGSDGLCGVSAWDRGAYGFYLMREAFGTNEMNCCKEALLRK